MIASAFSWRRMPRRVFGRKAAKVNETQRKSMIDQAVAENKPVHQFANSCVAVALKELSQKDDKTVIQALGKHGWQPGRGMLDSQWQPAMKELGINFAQVWCHSFSNDLKRPHSSSTKYTLGNFLKTHPTGTYAVVVPHHILVVRDGVVIDKNWNKPALTRRVRYFLEVINAPAAKSPFAGKYVKVRARPSRQGPSLRHPDGTDVWRRTQSMLNYLAGHAKVTSAELHKNTTYTARDLEDDIKRGSLEMHD